jgi:hypothetical protein
MKKSHLLIVVATMLAACGNKQTAAPAESDGLSNEVAFEVAKNYFFKNDQEIPVYRIH